MTAATQDSATPYAFNNDKPTGGSLLDALAEMLDPFTEVRLKQAGLTEGSRCLEIGAGKGTVAAFMADVAGPAGEVIATDIKPQHIAAHPGVTVLEHNILTDELPAGDFDIIHARAVLQHLPQRNELLVKLKDALRPGGALVIEELESRWGTCVLATPDERAHEVYAKYEKAMEAVLRKAGNDPTWNRKALKAMRDAGLHNVNTEGWQRSFEGGTGICQLAYSGSTELQEKLIATGVGITAEDLDILRAVAIDPSTVLRGMLLVSTTGYKS